MKTGVDIKLKEPTIISIWNAINKYSLKYEKEFYNKTIESIQIEQEVDNDFTDWIGRGKIEYILKIRFM